MTRRKTRGQYKTLSREVVLPSMAKPAVAFPETSAATNPLPLMTNFNVRGLPSIFRTLGGLWGKLLGSLTALCLLASILYGGWRGWREPAIVIHSFQLPALTAEGPLAFTG